MKFKILFLFITALLGSCHKDQQTENRAIPLPTADSVLAPVPDLEPQPSREGKPRYISKFAKAFFDFQTTVFNEDAEGFNQFIDPERGVYIIENPGALPKMTHVKDIRDFKREFQGQNFFTIKDRLQTCNLKEEDLPAFNCGGQTEGNTGYSKEGCFAADADSFRKTELFKNANLPEQALKQIEETLPMVQRTVLQTSSSYQFHFGVINGEWKILFIDLRIPCSA